ncbi:hypothetical protein CFR73_03230 [Novacetimonas maltaceti]|uniref:hypothetical protein n=1 Tax=Novacetimonas maltaceti TaxID=1203393 RepID=UPI000D724EC5|nr:hypothetical protein [Novacetimonas maltaceti]PYD61539.1 hypothetical protein CFR73_03230 [Novacetimonas maltaceti]
MTIIVVSMAFLRSSGVPNGGLRLLSARGGGSPLFLKLLLIGQPFIGSFARQRHLYPESFQIFRNMIGKMTFKLIEYIKNYLHIL